MHSVYFNQTNDSNKHEFSYNNYGKWRELSLSRGDSIMYDRRWYDSNENTKRALEILKDMDESQRRALSKDLTTIVKQIKELHEEDEESDVSLGIDRVLGLYKLSNSRRWYDKVSLLSYAMKTMSTLPQEDFYNIMEGIAISAGAESVA